LAPGYSSYQEGEYFVVIKGTIVRNADEFTAAAADANVDTMIFANDIDFGTDTAIVSTNKVIMGNGYKLTAGGNTTDAYGLKVNNGAKVVVNNVKMIKCGGFHISGGADVTVNDVTLEAKFSATSRNAFYVYGATLTVNSGKFEVVHSRNRYFASMSGSEIFVKGGTFEGVVTDDFTPVLVYADSKLEISGGSFNVKNAKRQFDPTPYLAPGYKTEDIDGYRVVSAE
jgi:hypothetical protein